MSISSRTRAMSRAALSCLLIGVLAGLSSAQYFSEIPFLKVFDPGRQDGGGWKGEEGAQIRLSSFEGVATLETKEGQQSWAAVYKHVNVNLDQHPLLQIHVLSVTKQWYLVLSGPQFTNGYIRLNESNETGHFSFDIAHLTDLKGPQKFDIKIGVSDPSGARIGQEKLIFDKLVFASAEPAPGERKRPVKWEKPRASKEPAVYALDPQGAGLDEWQESVKNGPEEVRFDFRDGVAIVKGRIDTRNWAAAHREISVDLDQFPTLEINVLEASSQWYVILSAPSLPQGFIRLIETEEAKNFTFHIPRLTKLTGYQTFDVQVGVSRPDNLSVKGEWVAFNVLRFKR